MEEAINLEAVYRKLISLEDFMKRIEQIAEDLEFAKKSEEAHCRIELENFISSNSENVVDEMMKW